MCLALGKLYSFSIQLLHIYLTGSSHRCGIRPLVSDPNKDDTQSLARNHIVHVSDSKLVTIAGGKWTTYRAMAEHTLDAAIKACDLKPLRPCITDKIQIEGSHGWTPTM